MIVLTPLKKFTFPVNAECINPDIFQGKDTAEIANLTVFEGNKQKKLCDLFKIEEDNRRHPNHNYKRRRKRSPQNRCRHENRRNRHQRQRWHASWARKWQAAKSQLTATHANGQALQ